MKIETERLVLREPRLDDVDAFVEFVADDEVMRWIGGRTGDRSAAQARVERWIESWDRDGVGQFSVLLDGYPIGRVGLLVWDRRRWEPSSYAVAGDHAQAELGWALSRRFWGHGYATEAARAARDWARAEKGIDGLISLIAPDNVRSQSVAQKLGAEPGETVQSSEGPLVAWLHPRHGQAPAR